MTRTVKPTAAALSLLATLLVTVACSDEKPAPPSSPSSSPSGAAADESDAVAILDQAFTGIEEMGGGYGRPAPQIGNTLARTPDGVVSATVAFTCTGGATVAFQATLEGTNAEPAADRQICDGSVVQKSVELPKPGAVAFAADVTGSYEGSFAYAYYPEKKQQR